MRPANITAPKYTVKTKMKKTMTQAELASKIQFVGEAAAVMKLTKAEINRANSAVDGLFVALGRDKISAAAAQMAGFDSEEAYAMSRPELAPLWIELQALKKQLKARKKRPEVRGGQLRLLKS